MSGLDGDLFAYFDIRERLRLRAVCKLWRDAVDRPLLWNLLELRQFGPAPITASDPQTFISAPARTLLSHYGKHIRHLSTSRSHISNQCLKLIGEKCPNLRILSITEDTTNSRDTHLKILRTQTLVQDSGIETLRKCTQLLSLNVNSCVALTDKTAEALAQNNKSLLHLAIACPLITDKGAIKIASTLTDLLSLDISDTNITDASLKVIGDSCSHLQELSFSGCKVVTDEGVCHVIRSCRNLQVLRMARCPLLTDSTLGEMAHNGSEILRELDISFNPYIGDEGLEEIASATGDHLECLDVSYCHGLSYEGIESALAECISLVTLRCDGVLVAPYVHGMRPQCPPLLTLSMSSCGHIMDHAVSALALGCPSLMRLNMKGCVIKGFRHMAYGVLFSKFSGLRALDLGYCKLTDDSVCFLRQLKLQLHTLVVDGNANLSDAGLDYILQGCGIYLERLSVQGCHVGDATLKRLNTYAPNLQFLDIRRCSDITDTGIAALVEGCQYLKVLRAGISTDPDGIVPHEVVSASTAQSLLEDTLPLSAVSTSLQSSDTNCLMTSNSVPSTTPNASSKQCTGDVRTSTQGTPTLNTTHNATTTVMNAANAEHVDQNTEEDAKKKSKKRKKKKKNKHKSSPDGINQSNGATISAKVAANKQHVPMKLGNKSLVAISSHCRALRVLDLDKNTRISDPGLQALAQSPLAPYLEYISLCECPGISLAGVTLLIDSCVRLRHLTLTKGRQLTSEALNKLTERAVRLRAGQLTITVANANEL